MSTAVLPGEGYVDEQQVGIFPVCTSHSVFLWVIFPKKHFVIRLHKMGMGMRMGLTLGCQLSILRRLVRVYSLTLLGGRYGGTNCRPRIMTSFITCDLRLTASWFAAHAKLHVVTDCDLRAQ